MIKELSPIDNKIVLWGMSCVGKTTFAESLSTHDYFCFDAMFPWGLIETLNLPVDECLKQVCKSCNSDSFILDGWTLADKEGEHLPEGSCVYVIYAPYEQIISQYRIPVDDPEEHLKMFEKWYDVDYKTLEARYFCNEGFDFVETSFNQFFITKSRNWRDI